MNGSRMAGGQFLYNPDPQGHLEALREAMIELRDLCHDASLEIEVLRATQDGLSPEDREVFNKSYERHLLEIAQVILQLDLWGWLDPILVAAMSAATEGRCLRVEDDNGGDPS